MFKSTAPTQVELAQ